MAGIVKVAEAGEIPPGGMKLVRVDGEPIVLANVDGAYYAFSDVCPHDDGPLSEGELAGCQVTCPWHFSVFDVTTGEVVEPPAEEGVRTYPLQIDGGAVYVSVPQG
jgi:nitrite reductase/ring-hydroxylating ferredoxin subunit